MTAFAGPFAIAGALLVLGGVAKVWRPSETATALGAVGLPSAAWMVRAGGMAEAALGAAALGWGNRTSAMLVAVSYLAIIAFVVRARRAGTPIASCGCFGRLDTPPSLVHVGVNLAAVLAAVGVALDPSAGLPEVLRGQPLGGVPFALLLVAGTCAALAALTTLPRLLGALGDVGGAVASPAAR